MNEQPAGRSATAEDANASAVRARKPSVSGEQSQTSDLSVHHSSEQDKATQKILDEIISENSRLKQAALPESPLTLAATPAQHKPGEQVLPDGTASALEHHDASFFKHDLIHSAERVSDVLGNSFTKYLAQGVAEAGKENFDTGAWVGKFETGAVIGAVMRTVLPKEGVIRAAASTIMAVNMIKDLAQPLEQGVTDAIAAENDKQLDDASRNVSKGVGNFVVDNLIGLPAAGLGESAAGAAFRFTAPGFEASKTEFWSSDKTKVGRFLNGTAEKVDRATSRLSETIKPTDPDVLARETARSAVAKLPAEKKAQLLQEAGEHARKHIESAEFYKLGPAIKVEAEVPTTAAPLGNSSVDERPISLGAIRRIKADDTPPKFSTAESDDPTTGHHLSVEGRRIGFSQFMDALSEGKTAEAIVHSIALDTNSSRSAGMAGGPFGDGPESANGIAGPSTPKELKTRRHGPDVSPAPDDGDLTGGDSAAKKTRRKGKTHDLPKDTPTDDAKTGDAKTGSKGTTPVESGTKSVDRSAKADDKSSTTDKAEVKARSSSSPKDDLKHSVFAKVAEVAKAVQELWTPEKVKLADARDQFRGPINATTEMDRAVLPPEYKPSTSQLMGLIDQIDSVKNLKAAGLLLMYHMKAANQLLFSQDNVRDLNMMTHELAGVFLTGMRKLGIPEDRLRRIIPSLVTETDDKGSGYFTLPPVDGVLDRPVTVVPRAFTRLISVMSDIIRHEALGHDHTYPELARFPEADRDNLIRGAIEKTMKEENIPDKVVRMNGENIKTSEFMFRLLKAEANENTSDAMGTISGGIGTAASMGVLLQSMRDGGLLETRNVYGKEFEDGIEPHGIDRWRIKLCAEFMRQLAQGDKDVIEKANALDQYAKEASRSGNTYTWASVDNPGENIELSMTHWDAVIPRIVKAQLDTPLDTLKDVNGKRHTLREMFGDGYAQKVKGIDDLADQFVDAINDGKTELSTFDKTRYTIGQVFSAGLVAWLRATRHGVDPVDSLKAIDSISSSLRSQYREFNPNEVPLTTPGTVKLKQAFSQSPAQMIRMTGAAVADRAPLLRKGADLALPLMAGTATGDVYAATQWLNKEAHEMALRTREVLNFANTQSEGDKP